MTLGCESWGQAKLPHSRDRCDDGLCHHSEAVGGPHEVICKEFLESSCPPGPRTTVFDKCELSGVPVCLLRPSPSWAPQLFTHPSWCFSDPLVKIMALSSPLWERSVFTLTLWLAQGRGASASPSTWSSWGAAFSFFLFFLRTLLKNKFIYVFIFGCVGSSSLHTGFL